MRIYLACTVRGDRAGVAAARVIESRLRALGHEVLTGHVVRDDVDEVESRIGNRQVFQRDLAWLDACDVLIAEASGSSFGVGFEVGYVLGRAAQSGQRVLLVYEASRQSSISRLISGNAHPHCATLAYADLLELGRFIDRHFPLASAPEGS